MTINVSQHYQKHIKNLNNNYFIYKVKKAFYLLTNQEERLYEVGFSEGFLYAAKVLQEKKEIVDSNKRVVGVGYKSANPKLIDKAFDLVCSKYYIGKKTLLSKDRHREIVRVRSIMHNLLFEEFGISISSIGRYFNQDHTTVLYSLNNKQNQTRYWGREHSIWQEYEEIKKALSESTGI